MAPVLAVFALVFTFAIAGQDRSPEPARIEGKVVDSVTGQPVRRAAVILRKENSPTTAYAALTDAAGAFEFAGIDEGAWLAEVQRSGYVVAGGAGPGSQTLRWRAAAGTITRDLTVRLTPAGVITGRVLDADGEPLAGVSVNAMPAGSKPLPGQGSYASTNDLGEFRLFNLAPGRYVIAATYEAAWKHMGMVQLADTRKGGQRRTSEDYVPTYYPAGIDTAQAVPVTVTAGRQVQGIDIRLLRAAVVRVRGRVLPPEGGLGPIGFVSLTEARTGSSYSSSNLNAMMRPGGEFEFQGVRPGRYLLQCVSGMQEKERLKGRQWLDVADSDIDAVQVVLSPPRTIQGKLTNEGGAALPAGLAAVLVPREEDPTHQAGGFSQVRKDGTFVFDGVYEGDYDLMLAKFRGEPDDFYVTRIRFGDDDGLDDGLRVRGSGPSKLEVFLSDAGATLECIVLSKDDKPVAGAQVIAVPHDRPHALALYGQAQTDDKGTCKMQGMAPGENRVYAFEGKRERDFFRADALKPYQDSAKSVRLELKQRSRVEVKAIPAEPEED